MQEIHDTFDFDEPVFTPGELAEREKVHPSYVRRLFVDEPGVIRLGRVAGSQRQRFHLRIPQSVAERVFARMTVKRGMDGSKPEAA